jgi:tRNA pseudouridine38-40 synthase
MPRYRLTLEYNGNGLSGWQDMPDRPTVQGLLKSAFRLFTGEEVDVVGAGRTDAGVHASGQVAHVDLVKEHTPFTVMSAVNQHLLTLPDQPRGRQVAIVNAECVSPEFHARFSATRRYYRYRMLNRRARPGLWDGYAWHVPEPLDADAMQRAAALLVGHHDFTSFRDTACQAKSPEKTLERLDVVREDEEVHLLTHARSFLHHQVRIMAGSLWMVGTGRWDIAAMQEALDARDRRAGGPTAPPDGLCLMKVDY